MPSPCQECPHRKLKCHDRCDEYLEWHDALVDAKKKLTAASDAVDFLLEMAQKREKKARLAKRK